MTARYALAAAALLSGLAFAAPASAAQCGSGNFGGFVAQFRQEAAAKGVSGRALAALDSVRFDQSVVNRDRAQGVFAQTFLEFSDRMVAGYRLTQGAANIKKHASVFQRIEKQYGVPAAVITGFWGLETDFGANLGDSPTLTSLATLAYDCRRSQMFQDQLLAALQIIDRGDLTAAEMRGPWAGELGQLQFLPTHYRDHAVDGDGDGRRNLLRSAPDALTSAGAYLAHLGWRRGEPWLQEVRVSANVPWQEADLAIRHPRSRWVQWGVTSAHGGALPADGMQAALLLPMGRNGPAFLAYRNFDIYLEWNQSLVYGITAAYYATRLAGAPKVGRGAGQVQAMSIAQVRDLQQRLAARGHDVGKIDGIIGENTRAAIKKVQTELGMPADSWPTAELLQRLR